MDSDTILLTHGDGGAMTRDLIESVFLRHFRNEHLGPLYDAAILPLNGGRLAMTTDSFVIEPLFFPGGDIGKLAVCGTVNDLSVCGAVPRYLSASFLIEEGFSVSLLEKVVRSMAETAAQARIAIVAGDTKVVGRGNLDGLFINTTGIGVMPDGVAPGYEKVEPGDMVLVSGAVGNHGLVVIGQQRGFDFGGDLRSDCAPLNDIIEKVVGEVPDVKMMRDLTRGGLATAVKEIALGAGVDFRLEENEIPVDDVVRGGCDMLGLDPLYLANEGKFLVIVRENEVDRVLRVLRSHPLGRQGRVIGQVLSRGAGEVYLTTPLGGTRRLDLLVGEPLPRIC